MCVVFDDSGANNFEACAVPPSLRLFADRLDRKKGVGGGIVLGVLSLVCCELAVMCFVEITRRMDRWMDGWVCSDLYHAAGVAAATAGGPLVYLTVQTYKTYTIVYFVSFFNSSTVAALSNCCCCCSDLRHSALHEERTDDKNKRERERPTERGEGGGEGERARSRIQNFCEVQ